MNPDTLQTLEFDKIANLIGEKTASKLGTSVVHTLLTPSSSISDIQAALKETTEFVNLIKIKGSPPLTGLQDVRPALQRALLQKMVLEPEQLLDIVRLLNAVQAVDNYIGAEENLYPLITRRVRRLDALEGLKRKIGHCIRGDGAILDTASPKLAQLRKSIERQRTQIKGVLQGILSKRKEIVQDSFITLRNGRYVIPLRSDFGKSLKGIVHDKSQSGFTFYVEPGETIHLNNMLANLLKDEEAEIYRILKQLTEEVKSEAKAIENNCHELAELDFIYAKARFSIEFQCREPLINSNNVTQYIRARHPLLIYKHRKDEGDNAEAEKKIVPLTVSIGKDYNTLLVSGPNTGGKTVALKTVGLLNLMVQAGCHIPADEGSNVGVFGSIFADIGDQQSIEQNLSTFSSHMKNIIDIVNRADESSLVLLDEIGSGTDPTEGAALGIALLEHLTARKVKTIATTHHNLLKTHAFTSRNMENGSFQFDSISLRPTYKFQLGLPGSSNALEIAQQLGLPEPLLIKARLELGDSRLKVHQLISDLKGNLKTIEEERKTLKSEKNRLKGLKKQYLRIINSEKEENESARRELERQVKAFIEKSREEIKASLKEIERKAACQISDAPAQRTLTNITSKISELNLHQSRKKREEVELHKGDAVFMPGLGLKGTLMEEPSALERAYVKCEDKTLRVPVAELQRDRSSRPETDDKDENWLNFEFHTESKSPVDSANIVGKTVEEALPVVEKKLDDAFIQGISSVTIIHGIGTGRLKEAVEELLNHHPLVKSFHQAERHEGGHGATVVKL